MLRVGDSVPPDVTVWLGPNDPVRMGEIVEDGPVLLLFYPFDWSST